MATTYSAKLREMVLKWLETRPDLRTRQEQADFFQMPMGTYSPYISGQDRGLRYENAAVMLEKIGVCLEPTSEPPTFNVKVRFLDAVTTKLEKDSNASIPSNALHFLQASLHQDAVTCKVTGGHVSERIRCGDWLFFAPHDGSRPKDGQLYIHADGDTDRIVTSRTNPYTGLSEIFPANPTIASPPLSFDANYPDRNPRLTHRLVGMSHVVNQSDTRARAL